MANSAQVAIRERVASLLVAVAGGNVNQNRQFALAAGVDSQVHVNFAATRPLEALVFVSQPRDWDTEIELVFLARKAASVEAADVADALWTQTYALLMADQTLGGLAMDLRPGDASVEGGEADTSVARIDWSVTVQHRTQNNALTP